MQHCSMDRTLKVDLTSEDAQSDSTGSKACEVQITLTMLHIYSSVMQPKLVACIFELIYQLFLDLKCVGILMLRSEH